MTRADRILIIATGLAMALAILFLPDPPSCADAGRAACQSSTEGGK